MPASTPQRSYDRTLIEGPMRPAVWKLAWPTMLTNVLGGLQGMIDHAMVGHYVGFEANAAIGVANQIFIVVIVFIMSIFTGMSVLVSRFVGAGDALEADRTVYQAMLTALALSLLVLAPAGYFLSPALLSFVNATDAVQAEALPYLRISCLNVGMLLFFMLSGALRSAGDAKTPMWLGAAMTVLNVICNIVLIGGLGPIPAMGTTGAAVGTVIAATTVGGYGVWKLWHGGWVVAFPREMGYRADWSIIKALFRFGLPTGIQGIAMNVGGVLMLAVIGSLAASAAAQAAYAVSYTQLFAFISWTAVGLMGAAAAIAGQNLGAGQPERAVEGVHVAARFALIGAGSLGLVFFLFPEHLLALFGMRDPTAVALGVELLRVLSVSGMFIATALAYTGGLQGTGDTKSPLYISVVSQILVPLGICYAIRGIATLEPIHVWIAILVGHITRCALSVWRFRQGRWKTIRVGVGDG